MASRQISDLEPVTRLAAERFNILCEEAEFDVLIYCTLRPDEEQAILYRQSRPLTEIKRMSQILGDTYGRSDLAKILMEAGPQHGPHVTNAAPGQSLHGYAMAFDGCPMRGGKPVWGTKAKEDLILWDSYGDLAEASGLEWSGRWVGFKEMPHCQRRGVKWKELI